MKQTLCCNLGLTFSFTVYCWQLKHIVWDFKSAGSLAAALWHSEAAEHQGEHLLIKNVSRLLYQLEGPQMPQSSTFIAILWWGFLQLKFQNLVPHFSFIYFDELLQDGPNNRFGTVELLFMLQTLEFQVRNQMNLQASLKLDLIVKTRPPVKSNLSASQISKNYVNMHRKFYCIKPVKTLIP